MQEDIKKEKEDKRTKKLMELENAQKVIKANELDRQRALIDKEN